MRLPKEFRLPGTRARVSHLGDGVLLEQIASDVDEWFAELGRFVDLPLLEDGRHQPPSARRRRHVRVNFLLNTNTVVALLRNKPPRVRERYRWAGPSGDHLAVSSVVLFELWYGVEKSSQIQKSTERLRVFLSGELELLAFDDDAETAVRVRATLERSGTSIGAYDLLIAGQALRRALAFVTANTSDFSRVRGLNWVDWAK